MTSRLCVERSERLRKYQLLKHHAERGNDVSFCIGDAEIQQVPVFKYLGRIIAEDDSDEAAIDNQLQRARLKWRRFLHILYARGMASRIAGYLYKAVVQAVFLYGSETWVLSKYHLLRLERFHQRIA